MKKKVIISESQLNNIKKIILEDVKSININEFDKIKQSVNGYYNIITSSTVYDILSNDINIREINDKLNKLYSNLYSLYQTSLNQIEKNSSIINNDILFDELENKLYNIYQPLKDKINVLTEINDKLIELIYIRDEEKIFDKFSDIKSINN